MLKYDWRSPMGLFEVKKFESVDEMTRLGRGHKILDPTNDKFVGRPFADWAHARIAARSPWPHGVKTIEQIVSEVADEELPMLPVVRRRSAWSEDDGDEVCLDRIRLGRPYWRTTRRSVTHRVHDLTIAIDVSTPGVFNAAKILYRGATAIVLTKLLEQAGHRVELVAIDCTTHAFDVVIGSMLSVQLKRTDDALDIATLANATSGWFYRTCFLDAQCLSDRTPEPFLGYASLPSDTMLRELTGQPESLLVAGVWNHDEAVMFVRRTLRQFANPDVAVAV